MADDKQEPQFLGGGPKFNRAGAQPPDTEPATASASPPFPWRLVVIALVALLLVGVLYEITKEPSGWVHVGGRTDTATQGQQDFKHDPGQTLDNGGPASTP